MYHGCLISASALAVSFSMRFTFNLWACNVGYDPFMCNHAHVSTVFLAGPHSNMARAFDWQGVSAAGDSAQQQRHQVASDAELVIDESLGKPKGWDIDDESFGARRLQLIKSAERRMAPRFLLGIFLTIFVNYIDRWAAAAAAAMAMV